MTADFFPLILTAFLLGLGSSAHCMGMCGGIACALGLQDLPHPKRSLLLYHCGRLFAYAFIALLLGSVLQQAQSQLPALTLWLRTGAALLLLAMALHTLQWWRGILALEKLGAMLWRPLQKTGRFFLPANNPWQILALGFLWGWLPCALVYSTLAWAVTQGNSTQAPVLMLAFGAGTSPVLLASGMASQQLTKILQQPAWRYGMALLLAACAAWTLYGTWQHAGHTQHNHNLQDHTMHDHTMHDHNMHKPSEETHRAPAHQHPANQGQ